MKLNNLLFTGLVAVAGLSASASADGRNPGSLLLYPEFDNRSGDVTVLTVTNVADAEIDVEFMYIGVEGVDGAPVNWKAVSFSATLDSSYSTLSS